jgi:protocatechuate 3,4-dioxygenase beta subunit
MRYRTWLSTATFTALALPLTAPACVGQSRSDLYVCEGCEAIHERSFDDLTWQTTIPPEGEPGEPLVLTGQVFQPDGRTPAAGVIIYAYHTNAEGVYPTHGGERNWARRHGYLRGWVKTGAEGRYEFRTIRPATYPSRNAPAHIHLVVKEPGRQEYWIDQVVFEDDPLVDSQYRAERDERGGPGIIRLSKDESGTWQGRRDIVLEP